MCGLSQTVGSHEEIVCVCNCLFCLICTEFCLQGADGMVVGYCCFLSCCDQTTPHRVSLAITNKPPMLVCWALNQDTVGMDWLAYRAVLAPQIRVWTNKLEWNQFLDGASRMTEGNRFPGCSTEGSWLWRITHQRTIKAILLLLVFLVHQVQIKHRVKPQNKATLSCNILQAHWKCVPLNIFLQNKKKNVPIHTNHCSFQLKWTLEAVKLWKILFLFTQCMICMLQYLKTDTFECVVTYMLHMHEFSNSVGLLGSSRDPALHLSDEELGYEPR